MSLFPLFPHLICHKSVGPDAMILVFRMLSFKPTFLFHFHQEALYFITFCHKCGVICMRLLIFLPAVLIPTCASSSPSRESCNLSRAKDKSAFQILIYVIWIALIASFTCLPLIVGFPGGASGKEPAWQCRRHKRQRFNPWVGKIPWRRKRQPTPVFLPGKSHGQRNWWATVRWGSQNCTSCSLLALGYFSLRFFFLFFSKN